MYNWNAHMRGAGFPVQPQHLMQIPGAHLPFQFPPNQWGQQGMGMGMMMTPNWPSAAQPPMFPSHGLPHGLMTGPVTAMMGAIGPAPPSQPPPPLPAEPPPPSPKAQHPALPPPPPPAQKDTHTPLKPENANKGDQADQSSSAENVKTSGEPKPPHDPAPNQPRPPQSPAPDQPKPPQSPAPGHPKPSVSSQSNPPGMAPNQVNPRVPAPNQVNPLISVSNQVNPRVQAPNQVNPRVLAPNQVRPQGPAINLVNLRATAPSQVNPQGPVSSQVNPGAPTPNQVNSRGPTLNQAELYQHKAAGHPTPQGQASFVSNPIHSAAPGHPKLPEPDKLPPPEKIVPDPALVAELERIKVEENLFMEQFKQWKQQYDDWREQNQNHPNKQQFEQYLEQWRTYEQQMEIRRNDIKIQKQNIEDKLSRPQATPMVSQQNQHWQGTHAKSGQAENMSQDMPGQPGWNKNGQHVREDHLVKPFNQRSGDSAADHTERGDISKASETAMPIRMNTFSGSQEFGKTVSAVHQSSYGVGEEKGEEDMNLEDDDECGVGGIIESGQMNRNVWQDKPTKNSDSYQQQQQQQNSDRGWNSWSQGRGQREDNGNSLSRTATAESTGTARWTEQRGSKQGFEESGSMRGRGRGGWNNVDPDLKSHFNRDKTYMDSDLRLMRPAGGGRFGQPDDEYPGEDFNREQDEEFGNGEPGNVDDFHNGRGGFMTRGRPWHRGGDNDFQRGRGGGDLRGRGGEFFRGRGSDFQMGRGDFHRGRGGDFYRGWRGNFPVGRGDFQGDRRGDFQMGVDDDFVGEGRGGMFNNSFGPDNFERGRGRGRGRGGPSSLLTFDFNEGSRHQLSEEEMHGREQDNKYDTALEDQGQGLIRARETQRYLDCGDEDDSGGFFPRSRREIGIGARGESDGGRGRAGFRNDLIDKDNQSDLNQNVRGQAGINNSSFNDGQRFIQQGRLGPSGGTRDGALFNESEDFQTPREMNLRDNIKGSMRGRQDIDPDRPGSMWENQRGSNVVPHDRPHNQQNCETAPGSGQFVDRGRNKRLPDEDEPEIKKGRLDDEREENSRHMPPHPGDPYRQTPGDRKIYRDYRDQHAEPLSGRPLHGHDRQMSDRFGARPSMFESPQERRSLMPIESIDYRHGGVAQDSKFSQPAEVIDYGHGQSSESTHVVDRERTSHVGLADRSYPDVLRGGAEVRVGREGHDQARMPEFIDRETNLRRSETSVRGASLSATSRYGPRGEQLGEDSGRGALPGNFRGWLEDTKDDCFDGDLRGDRAMRDRFNEEDDLRRVHRMNRFSIRDDRTGNGAKLFEGQGDDRPTLREHGQSSRNRGSYDYADDYYGRRGDYPQDPDEVPDDEDCYGAPVRDGRFGSSSGGDIYSRDDRSRAHALDRDGYSRALSPPAPSATPLKTSTVAPLQSKPEIVKVEDLLCPPNRENRPAQIVTIIRGLPGSGKTYASKLLREKEISCGGAAPRMLCLDDYFMVEAEREVTEPDTGRKVKKRVLEYEYEQALEETYRQSLLKSFKKTVDDGFFPFIIVDATNEKVAHFSEFWSYAKSKGFQVYVGELNADVPTCIQRNIHHWTEWDIEKVKNSWEPIPSHYIRLDLRWLLQEDSIPEVVMEDTQADDGAADKDAEEEDEESDLKEVYRKSKWELDTSEETLDKLDGIRVSKKHIAEHQSLNDYLQLDQMDDDYFSRESLPGKKRVRWADLEEKKNQSRRRNLGFIVGQTQQDWERITDDDLATKALNQTKYFYKN